MSSGARVEQRAITWSQDSRIPIKTYKNAPEHVWRLLPAYSRPNTKERWRLWLKTASLGYIFAHTTNNTKGKFQQKRLGRVPGEKAWQRYFVTESSRRGVIRNVGRSPGCSLLAGVFKPPNNREKRPLLVGKTHWKCATWFRQETICLRSPVNSNLLYKL